jgi:transglutaminase-like putative cysteine protease
MPFLAIRHLTTYRYRQLVAFGEHRLMLRPREGHDQRVLDAKLAITPEPSDLRWIHDVFGNSVAIAQFDRRSRELRFDSLVHLDHRPLHELDFALEAHAETYPFSYGFQDIPDLARSIERHYPDPDHEVDRWVRQFLRSNGPTGTFDLLTAMTDAVKGTFT